jgi:hypothetical protein
MSTACSFSVASMNMAIGEVPSAISSDATITLTNGITVAQAQHTFFFRTACPDTSFVDFYVDIAQWTSPVVVLNPNNGIVTSNAYVNGDTVGKDFLRDLAKQLFGTHLGAKLFTNEDQIILDIASKCDTVATRLLTLLSSIDKTSGTLSALQTDSSGNKYFRGNTTSSNISSELFNQLRVNVNDRFSDISQYKYNETEDGYYRLPILAGDSITFKITISPSSEQRTIIPTGTTSLIDRTYTVVLNVI